MNISSLAAISFLLLATLAGCGSPAAPDSTSSFDASDTAADSSSASDQPMEEVAAVDSVALAQWAARQDSLREQLLAKKPDNGLKGSVLEEFYLRGLAEVDGDSVRVRLPFDLHNWFDCTAPDCYRHEVRFSYGRGLPISFRRKLQVEVAVEGCVPEASSQKAEFILVLSTPEHIHYHSRDLRSHLILYRKDSLGAFAYYLEDLDRDAVTAETLPALVESYAEDDLNAKHALRIRAMMTNEYEQFLGRE